MAIAAVLTKSFCELLEHRISQALSKSPDSSRRRYWCDGVLLPEISENYSTTQIRKAREISARAWMCDGSRTQEVFQLIIRLGPVSVNALAQAKSLENGIPDGESDAWVLLEWDRKAVVVELL